MTRSKRVNWPERRCFSGESFSSAGDPDVRRHLRASRHRRLANRRHRKDDCRHRVSHRRCTICRHRRHRMRAGIRCVARYMLRGLRMTDATRCAARCTLRRRTDSEVDYRMAGLRPIADSRSACRNHRNSRRSREGRWMKRAAARWAGAYSTADGNFRGSLRWDAAAE